MNAYTGSVPDTPRATDWRDHGACRGLNDDTFFATADADIRHAKTICFRCPVQLACGQWALETRQAFGVWGGVSEKDRRAILRRRGIRIVEDSLPEDTGAVRKPGRPRAVCGTDSAYDRHVRNGEPADEACKRAHARKVALYREAGSAGAAV